MSAERVCSFDVSCECGDSASGLWSGEAADEWAAEHDCNLEGPTGDD